MMETNNDEIDKKVIYAFFGAAVLILGIFLLVSKNQGNSPIPKKYLLGAKDVEKVHEVSQNLDFAKFPANKSKVELVAYYNDLLRKEGWNITYSGQVNPQSYIFNALDETRNINVAIISGESDPQVEVTIWPRAKSGK